MGEKNFDSYSYHLIAGSEFSHRKNTLRAKALYNSPKATYALPISINLLTNSLIKTLVNADHSISVEAQQFPVDDETNILLRQMGGFEAFEGVIVSIIFDCFFYPLVALFVIHPLREASTNVKHLQRMTGASGFGYWGTMFLFDFLVMLTLITLVVVGFVIIDVVLGLHMFTAIAICKLNTCLVIVIIVILLYRF